LPAKPAAPAVIDWLTAVQGKPKGNKNKQTKPRTAKSIAPTEPAAIACRTCRNRLTRCRTRQTTVKSIAHAEPAAIACRTCCICRTLLHICTDMNNSAIWYWNTAATASFSPDRNTALTATNSLHSNQRKTTTKHRTKQEWLEMMDRLESTL
jgi:hypothetical protein